MLLVAPTSFTNTASSLTINDSQESSQSPSTPSNANSIGLEGELASIDINNSNNNNSNNNNGGETEAVDDNLTIEGPIVHDKEARGTGGGSGHTTLASAPVTAMSVVLDELLVTVAKVRVWEAEVATGKNSLSQSDNTHSLTHLLP